MGRDAIPEDVRSFIAEHVRSVIALELFLLLHADPSREWTAAELARELRAEPAWAERELQSLVARGLVAPSDVDPSRFRYAPRRAELDVAAGKLAAAYPEWRYSIIQILYSAPSEPIQSFADAFKLRKEPTDG